MQSWSELVGAAADLFIQLWNGAFGKVAEDDSGTWLPGTHEGVQAELPGSWPQWPRLNYWVEDDSLLLTFFQTEKFIPANFLKC